MGDKKAHEYLSSLFEIKSKISSLTTNESKDSQWFVYHEQFNKNGICIESLPKLLSLIHPDFYFRKGESFACDLDWKNNNFSIGILSTTQCQSHLLNSFSCVFNNDPRLRGVCEADHRWPNSLGGPTVPDNRLILCKFHNVMKSNDISKYHWDTIPLWLEDYLGKIYRLKQ